MIFDTFLCFPRWCPTAFPPQSPPAFGRATCKNPRSPAARCQRSRFCCTQRPLGRVDDRWMLFEWWEVMAGWNNKHLQYCFTICWVYCTVLPYVESNMEKWKITIIFNSEISDCRIFQQAMFDDRRVVKWTGTDDWFLDPMTQDMPTSIIHQRGRSIWDTLLE